MKINDKIKKHLLILLSLLFVLSGALMLKSKDAVRIRTELDAAKTVPAVYPDRTLKYYERLDLNTATQEEIEKICGIGPVLARRIVEYRDENGGFSDFEELKNVYGIDTVRVELIRHNAYLGG